MLNLATLREFDEDVLEPAYLWVPEYEFSSGREVVEFAETFGRHHEAEERLALELMYAERPDGRWLTLEDLLVVVRQNFKTFTGETAAIADLFLFDNALVIWTAHRFDTTEETFRRILGIVENYDHLRKRVKKVTTGNGDEGIELLSGARFLCRARSTASGRGLTADSLFLDEWYAGTAGMIGALMPTLSSVPNPKIRYLSSPGMARSAALRDLRDRGRAGGDPSLSYLEYGDRRAGEGCRSDECDHARTAEGCALDDLERIKAANPAMRRGRITVEFVQSERRSMSPEEYARERAGWWDEPKGEAAISSETWELGLDEDSEIVDDSTARFAFDVSPLMTTAAIVVAGLNDDDDVHVEVTGRDDMVDARDGIEWVVPRLIELYEDEVLERVAIVSGSTAEILAPALEKAGIEVDRISTLELAASCGHLYALASGRRLRHVGQLELDQAIENVRWKDVGDGARTFARRRSAGDITTAIAAAVAVRRVDLPDDDTDRPLEDDEIFSSIH